MANIYYTKDELRLIWTVLKEKGSASSAESVLLKEHKFRISKVTILVYLRNKKFDEFGEPGEVELMRNEIRGRQGVRYGHPRKADGRTKVVVKKTTQEQTTESVERRREDEKILRAFSKERLGLLPETAEKSLTGCKFPREDEVSNQITLCSKHTVANLYSTLSSVPSSLKFGQHYLSYCPVHLYAMLTADGRRRLMDAVSSLSLALVA